MVDEAVGSGNWTKSLIIGMLNHPNTVGHMACFLQRSYVHIPTYIHYFEGRFDVGLVSPRCDIPSEVLLSSSMDR